LIKFDYCDAEFYVSRSKVKEVTLVDAYELALASGVERFFNILLDQPLLTICETIGQIALPTSFFFKLPVFSFTDFQEISSENLPGLIY
jgi:hypothetical protein